jgi:predicted alpha/beta hydrolase family esterase
MSSRARVEDSEHYTYRMTASVKQREILFLHSAGPQGRGEGSHFLTTYLRECLEPEFTMVTPAMPDPENPHYKPWKRAFEKALRECEGETAVIGHSLGASVALKYLSEKPPLKAVSALFLVGAVYWGLKDWKVDEYTFERNFHHHLRYIPNIFFYHSKNDAVVPISHLRRFAAALPGATIREFEHDGHLFGKGIPQLVADIKALTKW